MPRLAYTGGQNPFENLEKFVTDVRKEFTGISDDDVAMIVKMAVLKQDPRIPRRTITLFGRDIMSDDVQNLPVWNVMSPSHRTRILSHPVATGEKVDHEQSKVTQIELVGRLDRKSVNRSVLISPRGLEHTYVWSSRTGFEQDVTPKDAELIMSVPALRRRFRDVDVDGPYTPVRAYNDAIVIERHVAHNASDVQALQREYTRRPHHLGVDLKKGT